MAQAVVVASQMRKLIFRMAQSFSKAQTKTMKNYNKAEQIVGQKRIEKSHLKYPRQKEIEETKAHNVMFGSPNIMMVTTMAEAQPPSILYQLSSHSQPKYIPAQSQKVVQANAAQFQRLPLVLAA